MKNITPKVLEKDIQREICEWLAQCNFFFWRQNTTPIFGMSGSGTKSFRSMPKYAIKGLPDIIVLHEGIFIGIEVKRPTHTNKRKDQEETGQKIIDNGGFYFIARSLEEAKYKTMKIITSETDEDFFPTSQP